MSRIAEALGAVREVLESNYPSADVRVAESGESDFRVGSIGATISVHPHGDYEVTDSDIEDIKEAVDNAIDDRHLVHKGKNQHDGADMFDLKK